MVEEFPTLSIRSFIRMAAHVQMLPILESGDETLVGGQAVMEGVMMRSPHSYCVAVRKPNGSLITQEQPLEKVSDRYPLFKYPVLRGLGTLGQAMGLGIKALRFSANAALDESEGGGQPQEISSWMMALNLIFSLGFFIFLYKFVPLWIATKVGSVYRPVDGRFAINMMDGIIRIGIFLAFLWLISRMKEIRRVFEYHGAEHKVVFNFESGEPVTVANAQKFTTFHPRCGTSFLLVVMVVAMLTYTVVPVDGFVAKFLTRIALLPLIAGVSYELIRFAAKRRGSFLAMLTSPGLWLQRITTKPPSDDQTAVAIRALDGAMEIEKAHGGELIIA